MAIDVKKIFINGMLNTDLLEAVLNELNNEVASLANSITSKTKHNEKIDLLKNFGYTNDGEQVGTYYIKTELEIKKLDSIYVFYDVLSLDGSLQTMKLPVSTYKTFQENYLYLNPTFDKDSIVNLYITYEY